MARRRRGVTFYLDEHIAPDWAIRINESRYRGQDELSFIGELRSRGAVLLTSDIEFVDEVVRERIRHGGIWLINPALQRDERVMLASINAGLFAEVPARQLRDVASFLAHDGLRLAIGEERSLLVYSFDQLREDLDIPHPDG